MATRRKQITASKQEQGVTLSVEWEQPEGIPTSYVTNFAIQKDEPNYILSFYEIKPPVILGPDDYQVEEIRKRGIIKAEYVARLVVTEKRLREFIKVVTDYMEREPTVLAEEED